MSKALPIFGGIIVLAILYFAGATYWNLTSITSLIHSPKDSYNLNLRRIPVMIEVWVNFKNKNNESQHSRVKYTGSTMAEIRDQVEADKATWAVIWGCNVADVEVTYE